MVSVHLNKFEMSSAKGAQIFYSPQTESSLKLANCIKDKIKTTLQPENHRTVKKATSSTYLLYYSPVPSVIAECGFMSNSEELELLTDDEYQRKMAFAIYCGILEYYRDV